MGWNCCLLLFILSLVSKSHAFVEIIQQRSNWIEANKECVDKGGRLAHADELHQSTCANNSIIVWLGKYNHERLTPWIANMGCFVTTKQKLSKPSVLECYRFCKSTPFGYQEPWCSCEDETQVNFIPNTPCITKNINGNNGNNSWLYNKTEVILSNEDYKMDCIAAMCTGNNTTFRAVNCSESKIVYCQSKDYVIRYNNSNTQAKNENTCMSHSNHLISRGVHGLCMKVKNTPEFWTGIKRFRYNDIGMLTDKVKCAYVRCQNRIGQETFEYCRRQLDGFACNINGTSDNVTTVKQSPNSALAPVITSLSESSALHLGYVFTNVPLQSIVESTTVFTKGRVAMSNTKNLVLPTSVTSGLLSDHTNKHLVSASIKISSMSPPIANTIDMKTTVYSSFVTNMNRIELMENNIMHRTTTMNSNNSKIHQSSTVKQSPNSALAPVITSLSESSALHLGYVFTNVPLQSIVESTTVFTKGRVAMSNTKNLVLPTSVTSGLLSDHTNKHLVSASIKSSSMSPPIANTIDMKTTVYSSFVTNMNRIELMENNIMHRTTTMNSNNSKIHQSSTVKPSPNSALAPVITSLSESSALHLGYVSTNVPLQSIVESTTVFTKGRVAMSNTENLVLPTSVTSELLSDHTNKHLVSASIKSSLISPPIANTIDMTTTVHSSFFTNKNRIDLMENNIMHSTTIMSSNNSKIHQSSTGLIVGISVSTLAVLIIASFGICRLRRQGPFKKKAEDYTIPIPKTTDPNYHDIDLDLEKETHFIDNDSKHHFLETKGDDIQFKPTDNTPNGKTNIPNNAYAVVVQTRIPDAIKTERNQDKDENTFPDHTRVITIY